MKKLRVTVDGKIFEVTVEMTDEPAVPTQSPATHAAPTPATAAFAAPPAASAAVPAAAGAVLSPLAGKVVSIDVQLGASVAAGAQLATIEAMKMNTFVFADKAGTVKSIIAKPGEAVEEGGALLVVG